MDIITKQNSLLYTEGANIDANYGPWDSIDEYETWAYETLGREDIEEGTIIAIKDNNTIILYVCQPNGEWSKVEPDAITSSDIDNILNNN